VPDGDRLETAARIPDRICAGFDDRNQEGGDLLPGFAAFIIS
jgi:hypothetical protein